MDEEDEKLQDLWGLIKGIDDVRWRWMLQLFYKVNDNLIYISEHLHDIKNYLSTIAEKIE